jgi:hypothetical protein
MSVSTRRSADLRVTAKVMSRELQFTRLCYDAAENRLYAVTQPRSIWHIASDAATLLFEFPASPDVSIESLHTLPPGQPAHMVLVTTDGRFWTLTRGVLEPLDLVDTSMRGALRLCSLMHVDASARLVAVVGSDDSRKYLCRLVLQDARTATLECAIDLGDVEAVRGTTTDARGVLYILDNRSRLLVADLSLAGA